MKVKEESEKAGLKLNFQKAKIMAFSPLASWEIDGETMETVRDFIFLGSKITADGDCSHEIKSRLLLGRKVMTNLRKWQPTPVFLPGESHGRRNLVGYSPRGHKESDMTERLHFLHSPILTPIHDYWKNHSFDYIYLCWQSNVSAFGYAF